jgi:hypothetical protein
MDDRSFLAHLMIQPETVDRSFANLVIVPFLYPATQQRELSPRAIAITQLTTAAA